MNIFRTSTRLSSDSRSRTLAVAVFVVCLACVVWLAVRADDDTPLEPVGTIDHPPIREASGLSASRAHPGVFWTLSDSQNPPDIYAIDSHGKLLAEYRLKDAVNVDWESLAIDDAGFLYVGDVGNNIIPGGLPRRWVYRVKEPDPATWRKQPDGQPPAEWPIDRTFNYTFPDERFDVEAMFVDRASLFLVSKTRDRDGRLYRLPLDGNDSEEVLEEICPLRGIRQATGADLSLDGRRLAVCSYRYAAVFRVDPDKPLIDSVRDQEPHVVRFARTSIEACAWDGNDLVLASEGRDIYRITKLP